MALINRIKSISLNTGLIIGALIMLFPTFWMLGLSLTGPSPDSGILALLRSEYTLQNYSEALNSDSFGIYFVNSMLVAICVTAGNVLFCLMAGYAFSRRSFFGKKLLFASVLAVLMIPTHVIMIPLYRLIVEFGWINTYYALIVPWLVTPFGIFLVKQYIDSIPEEIENAARIDGAGDFTILFRIIMPLAKPILAVLAIYTFLNNWNSFLFPFLFTNETAMRTLPVGLTFYLGKQSIDWHHLMAGASISALPILVLFAFFQKTIIKSLTAGALK
jgi:multiple sugar transport system permease protein